jgi:hypothetical protein
LDKIFTGGRRLCGGIYECREQTWHNHFSGYKNEGRTYIEYGRTPKFIDLESLTAPQYQDPETRAQLQHRYNKQIPVQGTSIEPGQSRHAYRHPEVGNGIPYMA